MRTISILFLLFSCLSAYGQTNSETNLFSFESDLNETISLSLDTISDILVFRNGDSKGKGIIIKDHLNDNDTIFVYSYYFRGGGVENAGLDLNYVTFNYENDRYEIYDEYSAEGQSYSVGLRIFEGDSEGGYSITGKYESIKGSIIDFRYNGILPIFD